MIVDATAPTVNGLENNKTYCGDVKFTVTDEQLDKVTDTIGEETKTLEAVDGEYTLQAGTHKITATDKAGNKTEVPFGGASLDTNKEDLIAAKGIFTPKLMGSDISNLTYFDAEFDKETNTLKFVTDRFSTYAIAYTDNALVSCVTLTPDSKTLTGKGETVQLIASVTPDNAVNKKHDNQKVISSKTGDTSDVTLWTTVFAAALAGIIGIFARRKKEQQ